jgi:hypothetical protein
MADNLDLITAPVSAKLATDVASHSGVSSHAQVATLYEVTGAEGSKTLTPAAYAAQLTSLAAQITTLTARLPAALGTNGGLKSDIVGDTGTASVLDTDNIAGVSLNTKSMLNGSTTLTPKFAKIAAASSGDNTLVAAVTSKKIRVLSYNFIANGTVNAKFQSGASGTDLTGLKYCVVNSGLVAPFNPLGWFESASGVLLNLNLSAAIAVGGELVYVEV